MSLTEELLKSRRKFGRLRRRALRPATLALLRAENRLKDLVNLPSASADVARYEQMVADNRAAPSKYQAGKFWQAINDEFSTLIYSGALANLRNQYFNRRFSGPEPASWQVYSSLVWMYYNALLAHDATGWLRGASDPVEGGAQDQILVDGRPLSLDFLQSVEEAFVIRDAWTRSGRPSAPKTIVELGSGYGRLANVCRQVFPDCTYVLLDLPEALCCAASWLGRVRKQEVVDYAQSRTLSRLDRATLQPGKIYTLGAHQIESIADGAADVFANAYSFAEMPSEIIANYFTHVDRTTTGLFYTKQRGSENNEVDRETVSASTYPVRAHWKPLLARDATLYPGFFEQIFEVRRIDGR
jgi:putative sugar O-methyltransferase